jgi:hypothetical protein
VWFEDEARFGQKGSLTTVWAERGTRPSAPKQTAYANLHVLTAVCPATGRAEGLVAPRLNAAVVQTFLDGLSATVPAGAHVVLVWDGAGYHVAEALRVPVNLTVVGLPPYSPELNRWSGCGCTYGSTTGRTGCTRTSTRWRRPPCPGGGLSA